MLLYNFFTDSPAEGAITRCLKLLASFGPFPMIHSTHFAICYVSDLWRVVSNYTEPDIQNYYADVSVASSGVQKYDWENPILQESRHLDFSSEQHKILETELKMLCEAY